MRYANQELPHAGDRIRNHKGGFGTVTRTSPVRGQKSEPSWITVKWDQGIVDIEYDLASTFTLVSRAAEEKTVDLKVTKSE